MSTLDVCGHGRFTVLTGIGGEAWVEAARTVAAEHGLPIDAHVIGPGRALTDLFGDWAGMRETGETGCVLVRPDHHVAFRAQAVTSTAHADLEDAVLRILGRAPAARRTVAA